MLKLVIASNIVMVASLILRFPTLPPQIPLFFSRPIGELQLVDTWMIFLLPVTMDLIYIANNYLYNKFFLNNNLVNKIFNYLNIFLIVGFTLIFIKIVFLVS